MKKIILCAIFLCATTTTHAAPLGAQHYTTNANTYAIAAYQQAHAAKRRAHRAETAAVAALMVAGLAFIVAAKASEHNPGQVQIMRF